jgi:hypothetical protein
MKAMASEFRFQVESDAPSVPYHLVDKDGKAREISAQSDHFWLVVWNMTFMNFHILGIIRPN